MGDPCPGFDVAGIRCVDETTVSSGNSSDQLILAQVLTGTPNRDPEAIVEHRVFDEDVRRITFHGDRVVPVMDFPPAEGYVVAIERVSPISVSSRLLSHEKG